MPSSDWGCAAEGATRDGWGYFRNFPGVNTSLSILPADPDTIKNSVSIFLQLV